MIRDVIALADKPTDDSDTVVVFLDLRPVAAPVFFLSLATPRLTYDDLERLLPRPIPDGWKLTVQGGRRRATHLEVHHRCTLLFGLVSVSVPDPPPEVSPASSHSSHSSPPDEDAEEEDPTDDHSQSSTRSRSRPRTGPRTGQPSPSSDRSYQPLPPRATPAASHSAAPNPPRQM